MILDIDAGNTRIKWRASLGSQVVDSGIEPRADRPMTAIYAMLPYKTDITRIRLLSVRSTIDTAMLVDEAKSLWPVEPELIVSTAVACGVTNGYSEVKVLGADRWAAIVAGVQATRQVEGPVALCVVDAGSALTIDLVDGSGAHMGGYIAPGLSMQLHALNQGTGNIALANIPPDPSLKPATNTRDAVIAGILLGTQQLIQVAIFDFMRQQGVSPRLLVTGGDGLRLLDGLGAEAEYKPDLVLDGMAFLCP